MMKIRRVAAIAVVATGVLAGPAAIAGATDGAHFVASSAALQNDDLLVNFEEAGIGNGATVQAAAARHETARCVRLDVTSESSQPPPDISLRWSANADPESRTVTYNVDGSVQVEVHGSVKWTGVVDPAGGDPATSSGDASAPGRGSGSILLQSSPTDLCGSSPVLGFAVEYSNVTLTDLTNAGASTDVAGGPWSYGDACLLTLSAAPSACSPVTTDGSTYVNSSISRSL